MSRLVYVDTNIYLDFLLDRTNQYGIPLGPKAWHLFKKVLNEDFKIVVSSKILEELYGALESPDQAKTLFKELKRNDKIVTVTYSQSDLQEAEKLSSESRNDALHALLARKLGCECVVTRNMRDFSKFSGIIQSKFPEDI